MEARCTLSVLVLCKVMRMYPMQWWTTENDALFEGERLHTLFQHHLLLLFFRKPFSQDLIAGTIRALSWRAKHVLYPPRASLFVSRACLHGPTLSDWITSTRLCWSPFYRFVAIVLINLNTKFYSLFKSFNCIYPCSLARTIQLVLLYAWDVNELLSSKSMCI